jgi:hypothetical protein
MTTYERVEISLHAFLPLALVLGEWSVSRYIGLFPGERVPTTYCAADWVDPGKDVVEKRKVSGPRRESSSESPVVQPVA